MVKVKNSDFVPLKRLWHFCKEKGPLVAGPVFTFLSDQDLVSDRIL